MWSPGDRQLRQSNGFRPPSGAQEVSGLSAQPAGGGQEVPGSLPWTRHFARSPQRPVLLGPRTKTSSSSWVSHRITGLHAGPWSSLSIHLGLSLLPLWTEYLAHLTLRLRLKEPELGPEEPGDEKICCLRAGRITQDPLSWGTATSGYQGVQKGGWQLGSLLKRDGTVRWVRGWILSHDSFPTQTPAPLCIMILGTWGAPCSPQRREPELWSSEQGLVLGRGCAGLGWRPPPTQTRGSAPSAVPCTLCLPSPVHCSPSPTPTSQTVQLQIGGG